MDHHEMVIYQIDARITFFMVYESQVYSVETLKWECRWLLENNGTEYDQYEKSLGCLLTRQWYSQCCSCVSGS